MEGAGRKRAAQDNHELLPGLFHILILQHLGPELSRQGTKSWGLACAGGCPHLPWGVILSQFN